MPSLRSGGQALTGIETAPLRRMRGLGIACPFGGHARTSRKFLRSLSRAAKANTSASRALVLPGSLLSRPTRELKTDEAIALQLDTHHGRRAPEG